MASVLHDIGVPNVPLLEKLIRPAIVYVALVVLLRVFGKRELAQLNPFDLVVLLTLSNTVQNAIIGDDNSVTGGLIGAVALMLINYMVVRFMFKHRRLDEIVEGSPTVLMKDGAIDEKALANELLTRSELQTVAHRQGFGDLEEIDSIVLEPGGSFAIKRKEPPEEEKQRREILRKLDEISLQLEALRRGSV